MGLKNSWVWAVALLAAAVAGWVFWHPETKTVDAPAVVRIAFDYSRQPITRSSDLPLCREGTDPHWHSENFPECPSYTGTKSGDSRPQVVASRLAGDLNPAVPELTNQNGCVQSQTGAQFPSSQVTVAAANTGTSDLALTITANPTTPEKVPPGTYCGVVLVDRSAGKPVVLAIAVSLADRTQPPIIYRVVLVLFLGALVGYFVKWVADAFGTLAGAFDRRRRFLIGVPGGRDALPASVLHLLQRLDDSLDSSDQQGVTTDLQQLAEEEKRLDQIRLFAEAVTAIREEIGSQRAEVTRRPALAGRADIVEAIAAEERAVATLIDDKWPPDDPAAARKEWQRLVAQASALTAAMRALGAQPTADQERALTDAIAVWKSNTGLAASKIARAAGVVAVTRPRRRLWRHRAARAVAVTKPRRRLLEWAIDHRLIVLGVLAGVVVVLLGMQSQFVTNLGFSNSFGDYFALAVWAFAGQIAGTTVLDLAGKLVRPGS